jgi:transcriptional regulator with XRE-family HTH domain
MRSLRELRIQTGLSQEELGSLIGVDRVQVSRVETGVSFPCKSTKELFEAVLGPVDWLATAKHITIRNPDYLEAEKLVQKIVSITAAMSTKERKSIKELLDKYLI